MEGKKSTALLLAAAMAVMTLGGCGSINKDAIVATMDGAEVTLGVANFLCRYAQAGSDDYYAYYASYYGYDTDYIWSEDLFSSGSTAQEDTKDSIMESLHEMYTLKVHMDDYDVELTEEEEAAITEAATTFMESNSEEALEALGATQEIVEEVLTLYTIQSKMYDEIIKDADTDISDEEANMRGYSYIRQSISGSYEVDDDGNYSYVEYTDDEVEQFEEDFTAMYEAVEDGSDFDEVAEEYGYTVSTDAYAADDDSLDEDLLAELDELAEGEYALVTLDSYYYLVRLDSETDEEATEENRETLIEEAEEAYYEEVLADWQEDDGWTIKKGQLKKIQFDNLFTTYTEEEADTESTEAEAVETTDGTEAVETTDGTEAVETTGTEDADTTEGTESVY